jgi:hypothetical protein
MDGKLLIKVHAKNYNLKKSLSFLFGIPKRTNNSDLTTMEKTAFMLFC